METLIVEPKNQKQLAAIKAFLKALDVSFRKEKESPYNTDFVAKIERSKEEVKEGKVTRVKKEDLQSFLGL